MESALKAEAEAKERVKALEKETKAFSNEKEKLAEKKNTLEKEKETIQKLAQKKQSLEDTSKILFEEERKLKKMGFEEKTLLLERKRLVEEKAAIYSAKKSAEANSQLVQELKKALERIEKTREQVKEQEETVKSIEANAEKMNLFVNSLSASQQELRATLIATINQAMDSIWKRIYPYKDYLSAKMDVRQGNYELCVKDPEGNWVRVEGILSGGERSSAAICIRIAFSFVLTRNLSWIILDEPTHNLDSQAVKTLSEMMQKHLPKLVEQIFVITHDTEMRKAATGSLYVLEKDSGEATRPVLAALEN
jgi:DNA repair exonuclease SbcCD ATPase subunit